MLVRDLMTTGVVSVPRQSSVADAARQMAALSVGCLLVMDDDAIVGVVTDRDLVVRVIARDLPHFTPIDQVMSRTVVTVDARADVSTAYELFSRHTLRRLPVTQGSEVVGVLAVDDLLLELSTELRALLHPVREERDAPLPVS